MARPLRLLAATILVTTACTREGPASIGVEPLPASASCQDAAGLRDRAGEARRQSGDVTGDRAQIIAGNRAKFLGTIAMIAQLSCTATSSDAARLVERALEVAQGAQTTNSEYEAARRWTEADLIATDAIMLLLSQLPTSPGPR